MKTQARALQPDAGHQAALATGAESMPEGSGCCCVIILAVVVAWLAISRELRVTGKLPRSKRIFERALQSKYPDPCADCGEHMPVGTFIYWRKGRKPRHMFVCPKNRRPEPEKKKRKKHDPSDEAP